MQKDKFHFKIKGFSTVEVILALAIISIISLSLASSLSYGIFSQSQANLENKANFLLDEGLEAVANIKDSSYFNLTNGTYGLALTGGTWGFLGSSDSVDGFTRTIQISTIDTYTKQAVVTVNWQNSSGNRSIHGTARYTNWERPTALSELWTNTSVQATVNLSGNADGIEILQLGTKVFVARSGSTNNFWVIDITDLSNPLIQGSISIAGTISDLAAYGNYVYASSANNSNELYIINVSNPSSLSATSINLNGNANANGLFVQNDRLYLTRAASTEPELYVYDVSAPATPNLLGSAENASTTYKLFVEGDYAYIASSANNAELTIYNISNSASPVFASGLNLTGNTNATDVAWYGNKIMVMQGLNLFPVDVSNPLAPTVLNPLGIVLLATSNAISGDVSDQYIFTVDSLSPQLEIYDLTNPLVPTVVDSEITGGNLNGIFYSSDFNRAFAVGSDDTAELIIYRPN